MAHNWIQTRSGVRFNLDDPKPEMVKIGDIAYALSMLVRYCGHAGPYTVAQHSVLVSLHCPSCPLWGLLHDAAEAYVNDVTRPVKEAMRMYLPPVWKSPFDDLEERVMEAVAKKFGLPLPEPPEVKTADENALCTERRDLFRDSDTSDWHHTEANGYKALTLSRIVIQDHESARKSFIQRFEELF